ncbi:MAG: arylsulfatase [Spirochaetaceae bacterium]|nr:MAG: arylsulfatase [Spirochaetaceae bacterium]
MSGPNSSEKRPNIVLILVDDMGYSDIESFGSEIATPNLTHISSKGIRFTQMYNCARCCPSRASLLTGLYPHQAGIGHMTTDLGQPAYRGYLNDRCVTIAEALRNHGYRTLLVGKWHVGGSYAARRPETWSSGDGGHPTPLRRGFERFYGILTGCCSYFFPHTLMQQDQFVRVEEEKFYLTDAISTTASGFIREYARGENPFFLFVSYTAPHWPLHALPEDIALYEGRYDSGWDAVRQQRYERLASMKIIDEKWRLSPRDKRALQWEHAPHREWEAQRMAVYAAQIHRMDQGVGQIVAALGETGVEENTLLFFLSDNGGCAEFLKEDGFVQDLLYPTRKGEIVRAGNFPGVRPGGEETYMSYDLPWANASNTPFRLYKHWVHEGGIATPMIVTWPLHTLEPGIVQAPAHVIDIMATCLDAAGATYPTEFEGNSISSLEGESLLPAVCGKSWSRERPIYWEHEGNCALRDKDWKLVRKYPGSWELYNLERDRTEQENLIDREPVLATRMIKEWSHWAERCGVVPWEQLVDIAPE